jgi:hypothetical protein
MLETEVVHVAALQRMDAVVDAEMIVNVKNLLRGVGASEPSALDNRLGGWLVEQLQDVAEGEERESDEGSPNEKVHVCYPWCGVVS